MSSTRAPPPATSSPPPKATAATPRRRCRGPERPANLPILRKTRLRYTCIAKERHHACHSSRQGTRRAADRRREEIGPHQDRTRAKGDRKIGRASCRERVCQYV